MIELDRSNGVFLYVNITTIVDCCVVCWVECGPMTSALIFMTHFCSFMFHVSSASIPFPLLPDKCRLGCSTGTCHLLNIPGFIFCFSRTKALVLELLAAVCLVRGGHEIILSAFDNFKEVRAAHRADLGRPVCHYI